MLLGNRIRVPLLVSSGAVFAAVVALGNLFPQQSPRAIQEETVIQKRTVAPEKASVSWKDAAPAIESLRSNATALLLLGPNENSPAAPARPSLRGSEVMRPKNDGTGNKRAVTVDISPELVKSVQTSSEVLNEKWMANKGGSVPLAYVESIKLDSALLGKLPDLKNNQPQANAILRNTAEDLAVKAEHCRLSPNGWASLISVKVNTLKGGKVVSGLEVWYVPRGWADVPEMWVRCASLSSPATVDLPPGVYMLRVSDAQPITTKIGGDGKAEMGVDLVAD